MHQKEKKVIALRKKNILKTLENIGAIFTGTYLHYGELPKKQQLKEIFQRR